MGRRLLGQTVYYREKADAYRAAIIVGLYHVPESPHVDYVKLFVFDGEDTGRCGITTFPVANGYGVNQWQWPEMVPHRDNGAPIPTDDYGEAPPFPDRTARPACSSSRA